MLHKLLTCFAFIAIIASCKKESNANTEIAKLPAATQTGANTCGCLLNDTAWIASTGDSGYVYTIGNKVFMSLIGTTGNSVLTFVVRGYEPTTGTTYNIHNGQGWSTFMLNDIEYLHSQNPANMGTITFARFDTTALVMSGTFSFSYEEFSNSGQTYPKQVFTNCRFDLPFQKY